MSRWAVLHCTAFRNVKHILNLFFVRFELGRLIVLVIIAITLTLFIADSNVVAERLFQSPTSPSAQPLPTQPPPPPPTQPPPATQPPTQPPPAEQPSTEQSSEQSPPQQSTEPSESTTETEPPVSEPLPEGSEPPPFIQPTVETQGDSFDEDQSFSDEEEASSSNFILDRVELIDSVVVSGAYVWLCCGAILLLLIPLLFLFLQIRGQIKIQREEDY